MEGKVQVKVVISPEGTVTNAVALSGHPLLIENAIAAVKQWRFRPFVVDGQPGSVSTVIELSFSLGIPGDQLTEDQIKAVVLAIQDEIYDYDYEGDFADVGEASGPGSSRLPLYISPIIKEGHGTVIYKLMPQGEIYRDFSIDGNGLVVLSEEPDGGFPPTYSSHNTLYMDDDEVCRLKHDWVKASFYIDFQPGKERIREASVRQKRRVGFSAAEFKLRTRGQPQQKRTVTH